MVRNQICDGGGEEWVGKYYVFLEARYFRRALLLFAGLLLGSYLALQLLEFDIILAQAVLAVFEPVLLRVVPHHGCNARTVRVACNVI